VICESLERFSDMFLQNSDLDWRLPYIVGGQRIKRVIILQNHYSIQDLLLEALLASLVLEELFSFQLRFIKWNP